MRDAAFGSPAVASFSARISPPVDAHEHTLHFFLRARRRACRGLSPDFTPRMTMILPYWLVSGCRAFRILAPPPASAPVYFHPIRPLTTLHARDYFLGARSFVPGMGSFAVRQLPRRLLIMAGAYLLVAFQYFARAKHTIRCGPAFAMTPPPVSWSPPMALI